MDEEGKRLPHLVILDLDYTLWPTNAYEEARGPYASTDTVGVARRTKRSKDVRCFPGVPDAMAWLADHGIAVAIASASPSARNALELLTAMQLVPPHMEDEWKRGRFFVCTPRSKKYHLQKVLREAACSAEDAIFFDDLKYNTITSRELGISTVEIDPDYGFSLEVLLSGLETWRRYRQPSIKSYFKNIVKEAPLPDAQAEGNEMGESGLDLAFDDDSQGLGLEKADSSFLEDQNEDEPLHSDAFLSNGC